MPWPILCSLTLGLTYITGYWGKLWYLELIGRVGLDKYVDNKVISHDGYGYALPPWLTAVYRLLEMAGGESALVPWSCLRVSYRYLGGDGQNRMLD